MAADRGRADTDARHQLVIAMLWQPDYDAGGNTVIRHIASDVFTTAREDYIK